MLPASLRSAPQFLRVVASLALVGSSGCGGSTAESTTVTTTTSSGGHGENVPASTQAANATQTPAAQPTEPTRPTQPAARVIAGEACTPDSGSENFHGRRSTDPNSPSGTMCSCVADEGRNVWACSMPISGPLLPPELFV